MTRQVRFRFGELTLIKPLRYDIATLKMRVAAMI